MMQRRNLVILCNLELHGIKRILRGILVLERRPNMVRVSVVLINLCRLVCCVVFLIYRRRKLEPVLRLLIHYTAILVMNFHVGLDRITVLAVQANKNNGFVLAIRLVNQRLLLGILNLDRIGVIYHVGPYSAQVKLVTVVYALHHRIGAIWIPDQRYSIIIIVPPRDGMSIDENIKITGLWSQHCALAILKTCSQK